MNLTFEQYEAIHERYPQVVRINGDVAYDVSDTVVQYDIESINAAIQTNSYKVKRQAEYPSYADQFDTIFHQGIDAWKAQIQAVKDKYPKG
jgi:hypothetical protein